MHTTNIAVWFEVCAVVLLPVEQLVRRFVQLFPVNIYIFVKLFVMVGSWTENKKPNKQDQIWR